MNKYFLIILTVLSFTTYFLMLHYGYGPKNYIEGDWTKTEEDKIANAMVAFILDSTIIIVASTLGLSLIYCYYLSRKNRLRTKKKTKTKWLNPLAVFLWFYPTSTFIIGYWTNTFIPFWWVILFVFPSVGLYCFAKWLWTLV